LTKRLLEPSEALKTEASAQFQAGVDAAKELVQEIVQEALDRKRMQKLESELNELRSRYAGATPKKRRGRKPKTQD
jgi:hypothetical protein